MTPESDNGFNPLQELFVPISVEFEEDIHNGTISFAEDAIVLNVAKIQFYFCPPSSDRVRPSWSRFIRFMLGDETQFVTQRDDLSWSDNGKALLIRVDRLNAE